MSFIWLYTFFGTLENHATYLANQMAFDETVFPTLGLGTAFLSLAMALLYYAVLNRISSTFKSLGWWALCMLLLAALAVAFVQYQVVNHTQADGSDGFALLVSGINALWAMLLYFVCSLLFKRHPITMYAQKTPF